MPKHNLNNAVYRGLKRQDCSNRDTVSDMRVLGRVRLSRATEESTSVERQREDIEAWARRNDHEVVGWAEDLDVSGSVDPFDTPSLGAWLSEKKHDWDIICSWKLDRISRQAIPMGKLFGWLQEHDKTLVCTADSIDLSTPMGRLIAYVIATIAEGELDAIRERNRASARKLRETGRWSGGKPIYGYRPRAAAYGAGWELVPDQHAAAVLLRVIQQAIEGESLNVIAADLNESGELSPNDYIRSRTGKKPRGHAWSGNNLGRILRSRALLGYTTHEGNTVRGADGRPVQKGPPLISQTLYNELQEALDSRSVLSSTRTRKTSPLLGVVICGVCNANMHHRKVDSSHRYYLCRSGHDVNSVRAEEVEEAVQDAFLYSLGEDRAREKVYIAPESHQEELDEAVRAVEEITPLLGTARSTTMRTRLLEQLEALDSRIAELEQLPLSEARWEWRELPDTYAQAWERADTEGRRQLLLRAGITFVVRKHPGTQTIEGELRIPQDKRERLSL